MIQDIGPHRYDNAFGDRREPRDTDTVMAVENNRVLLRGEKRISFPTVGEVCGKAPKAREHLVYLFTIDETAYFLLEADRVWSPAGQNAAGERGVPAGAADSSGLAGYFPDCRLAPAKAFREVEPRWLGYAGITACQLARWRREHRFCGTCGSPMRHSETERAFCCDSCGAVVYPKISPAVIVAVMDGDRLLLSRYAGRPPGQYALIAGYAEIGETLEDTVCREVMEEVGLRVRNLRYFASQPWSFSDSILMGFFADLDGSPEIRLDETELAEAVWLPREQVPEPKNLLSLTSTMIEAFRKNQYPR